MEHRLGGATEFRAADDGGKKYIEGYFAVFNSNYNIMQGYSESVDRHAFDKTLGDDIRALINHDTTMVLGRTKAKTLELKTDDRGLWGRITVNPEDSDAMNLYARVKRGDVSQCSFGFNINSEERAEEPNGDVHYTIKDVKLFEVSPCTFPAYEETEIAARSRDKHEEYIKWLETTKERMKLWH